MRFERSSLVLALIIFPVAFAIVCPRSRASELGDGSALLEDADAGNVQPPARYGSEAGVREARERGAGQAEEAGDDNKSVMPPSEKLTARQIIDRAIEAHGGIENLKRLHTARISWNGEMKLSAFQDGVDDTISLRLEEACRLPDQIYRRTEEVLSGISNITITVVNDDRGWKCERSIDGRRAHEYTEELAPDAVAVIRALFFARGIFRLSTISEESRLAVLDDIEVAGEPAVGVAVEDTNVPTVHMYFNRRTGLLVREDSPEKREQLPPGVEESYEAYFEQDGLKFFRQAVARARGEVAVRMELESLDLDAELDENLFTNPARH